MAAKTTPWWLRAIGGVLRGVRAGVAAFFRTAPAQALISKNGPEDETPQQEAEEETALSEKFPKMTPEAAPADTADAAPEPVAENAQAKPEAAAEAPAARHNPAPVEGAVQSWAAAARDSVDEPMAAVADLLAEAALGEEARVESAPERAADPYPPASPAAIEAASESAEEEAGAQSTAASDTIEEPEPVEPEALSGDAIEETVVTPEVETEATAAEPELDAALEAAAEMPPIGESEAHQEPASEPAPEAQACGQKAAEEPAEALAVEQHAPAEAAPAEIAATISAQPQDAEAVTAAEMRPEIASAAPQVAQREAIKKEEGPDTSPVSVIVTQVYEGPFDLLLDLIRKQDIDIYDIPIARITAQFLVYVNKLKASDMDVAGEFIYTASLLIHIKSKMLLPRNPAGPGEEAEDPRRELVERLLEHERFKNAAQMLQQKQMLESVSWSNPGLREFREDTGAEPEIAADTVDLVRIFREILERARSRPILDVQEDSVTVGQMIQFLGRRLTMEDKPLALRRLLAHTKSERALIAMFLALLELVRLQAILLRQDKHFSEIFIKKSSAFDAAINEGLARDDWQ